MISNKVATSHFSGAELSDDGRYVLITIHDGCDPVNKLFYVDLEKVNYEIKGIFNFTIYLFSTTISIFCYVVQNLTC